MTLALSTVTHRSAQPTRRRVLGTMLGGVAAGLALPAVLSRSRHERVVIVGGGAAGAEAALRLTHQRPGADVLLIERDPARWGKDQARSALDRPSRPDLAALTDGGVSVALDEATEVDWSSGRLALMSGRRMAFDRLVLAPGSAPVDEGIPGFGPRARHLWPAAWGHRREARRLLALLHAMPEDGHVVLRIPQEPSHPEAVVARARFLAAWIERARPSARMTVLDASRGAEVRAAYLAHRDGRAAVRLDWRGTSQGSDVLRVDPECGVLQTAAGVIEADVVNFLTPQSAGALASLAGVADESGWCPCAPDGRSSLKDRATVLGDARKGASRTIDQARLSAQRATAQI